MNVIVDGLMTNYSLRGSGSVVVLLHGWGDSAQGLSTIAESLADSHTVISVDLPGFGGTQAPAVAWGLDDYIQFVVHFLEKIGQSKVLAYVGHSNGGALAIRGLAQDVLSADKLVLIASAGIRNRQKGRKRALMMVAKAGKALTAPLPQATRKRLRQKLYARAGSDMLVAEHLTETFKRVVSQDVQQDARQLNLPTLLIYGSADEATPPTFGERYVQLIAGSRLEVIAGAGHFVHLEAAPQVQKLIREFL